MMITITRKKQRYRCSFFRVVSIIVFIVISFVTSSVQVVLSVPTTDDYNYDNTKNSNKSKKSSSNSPTKNTDNDKTIMSKTKKIVRKEAVRTVFCRCEGTDSAKDRLSYVFYDQRTSTVVPQNLPITKSISSIQPISKATITRSTLIFEYENENENDNENENENDPTYPNPHYESSSSSRGNSNNHKNIFNRHYNAYNHITSKSHSYRGTIERIYVVVHRSFGEENANTTTTTTTTNNNVKNHSDVDYKSDSDNDENAIKDDEEDYKKSRSSAITDYLQNIFDRRKRRRQNGNDSVVYNNNEYKDDGNDVDKDKDFDFNNDHDNHQYHHQREKKLKRKKRSRKQQPFRLLQQHDQQQQQLHQQIISLTQSYNENNGYAGSSKTRQQDYTSKIEYDYYYPFPIDRNRVSVLPNEHPVCIIRWNAIEGKGNGNGKGKGKGKDSSTSGKGKDNGVKDSGGKGNNYENGKGKGNTESNDRRIIRRQLQFDEPHTQPEEQNIFFWLQGGGSSSGSSSGSGGSSSSGGNSGSSSSENTDFNVEDMNQFDSLFSGLAKVSPEEKQKDPIEQPSLSTAPQESPFQSLQQQPVASSSLYGGDDNTDTNNIHQILSMIDQMNVDSEYKSDGNNNNNSNNNINNKKKNIISTTTESHDNIITPVLKPLKPQKPEQHHNEPNKPLSPLPKIGNKLSDNIDKPNNGNGNNELNNIFSALKTVPKIEEQPQPQQAHQLQPTPLSVPSPPRVKNGDKETNNDNVPVSSSTLMSSPGGVLSILNNLNVDEKNGNNNDDNDKVQKQVGLGSDGEKKNIFSKKVLQPQLQPQQPPQPKPSSINNNNAGSGNNYKVPVSTPKSILSPSATTVQQVLSIINQINVNEKNVSSTDDTNGPQKQVGQGVGGNDNNSSQEKKNIFAMKEPQPQKPSPPKQKPSSSTNNNSKSITSSNNKIPVSGSTSKISPSATTVQQVLSIINEINTYEKSESTNNVGQGGGSNSSSSSSSKNISNQKKKNIFSMTDSQPQPQPQRSPQPKPSSTNNSANSIHNYKVPSPKSIFSPEVITIQQTLSVLNQMDANEKNEDPNEELQSVDQGGSYDDNDITIQKKNAASTASSLSDSSSSHQEEDDDDGDEQLGHPMPHKPPSTQKPAQAKSYSDGGLNTSKDSISAKSEKSFQSLNQKVSTLFVPKPDDDGDDNEIVSKKGNQKTISSKLKSKMKGKYYHKSITKKDSKQKVHAIISSNLNKTKMKGKYYHKSYTNYLSGRKDDSDDDYPLKAVGKGMMAISISIQSKGSKKSNNYKSKSKGMGMMTITIYISPMGIKKTKKPFVDKSYKSQKDKSKSKNKSYKEKKSIKKSRRPSTKPTSAPLQKPRVTPRTIFVCPPNLRVPNPKPVPQTFSPSTNPSQSPSYQPTPVTVLSLDPSSFPSDQPSSLPSIAQSDIPSMLPSQVIPTAGPSTNSMARSDDPSVSPTAVTTQIPSMTRISARPSDFATSGLTSLDPTTLSNIPTSSIPSNQPSGRSITTIPTLISTRSDEPSNGISISLSPSPSSSTSIRPSDQTATLSPTQLTNVPSNLVTSATFTPSPSTSNFPSDLTTSLGPMSTNFPSDIVTTTPTALLTPQPSDSGTSTSLNPTPGSDAPSNVDTIINTATPTINLVTSFDPTTIPPQVSDLPTPGDPTISTSTALPTPRSSSTSDFPTISLNPTTLSSQTNVPSDPLTTATTTTATTASDFPTMSLNPTTLSPQTNVPSDAVTTATTTTATTASDFPTISLNPTTLSPQTNVPSDAVTTATTITTTAPTIQRTLQPSDSGSTSSFNPTPGLPSSDVPSNVDTVIISLSPTSKMISSVDPTTIPPQGSDVPTFIPTPRLSSISDIPTRALPQSDVPTDPSITTTPTASTTLPTLMPSDSASNSSFIPTPGISSSDAPSNVDTSINSPGPTTDRTASFDPTTVPPQASVVPTIVTTPSSSSTSDFPTNSPSPTTVFPQSDVPSDSSTTTNTAGTTAPTELPTLLPSDSGSTLSFNPTSGISSSDPPSNVGTVFNSPRPTTDRSASFDPTTVPPQASVVPTPSLSSTSDIPTKTVDPSTLSPQSDVPSDTSTATRTSKPTVLSTRLPSDSGSTPSFNPITGPSSSVTPSNVDTVVTSPGPTANRAASFDPTSVPLRASGMPSALPTPSSLSSDFPTASPQSDVPSDSSTSRVTTNPTILPSTSTSDNPSAPSTTMGSNTGTIQPSDSNTLLTSSPGNTINPTPGNQAPTLRRHLTSNAPLWTLHSSLHGDGNFGWSVSMSSNASVLVIGSFLSQAGGNDSGELHFYERNSLKNEDNSPSTKNSYYMKSASVVGTDNELLGHSISVSGDGSTVASAASQRVHLYVRETKNRWVLQQAIIDTSRPRFISNIALSVDGTTLVVSEYKDYESKVRGGNVGVYRRFENRWDQIGNDIYIDTVPGIRIPVAVSASGTYIAITMASAWTNGVGITQVYTLTDENRWEQIGNDIVQREIVDSNEEYKTFHNPNERASLPLGGRGSGGVAADPALLNLCIALSKDGKRVAVGVSNGVGYVSLYDFDERTGNWIGVGGDHTADGTTTKTIVTNNGTNSTIIHGRQLNEQFGSSIAFANDGKMLAIGSIGYDLYSATYGPQLDAGAIRIFRDDPDIGTWVQVGEDVVGTPGSQHLGYSVAISEDGKVLAVGAPLEVSNAGVPEIGEVKIFHFEETASA